MSALDPLSVIKAVERHARSEVTLGLLALDVASTQQFKGLVCTLRTLRGVTMDHVTETNEYLSVDHGTFNIDQRRELATTVKATMGTNIATPTTKKSTSGQKHRFLHNYFPSKVWAVLFSTDSTANKMRTVASFMISNLGLTNPSEKTKRLAVVCIHLAGKVDADPVKGYEDIKEFGRIIETKRAVMKHCTQTLREFPEDVQEFLRLYPEAFGPDDPPVACRLDPTELLERQATHLTPARNSAMKIRGKRSGVTQEERTPPATEANSNIALQAMLGAFFSQRFGTLPDDTRARYEQTARAQKAIEDGSIMIRLQKHHRDRSSAAASRQNAYSRHPLHHPCKSSRICRRASLVAQLQLNPQHRSGQR